MSRLSLEKSFDRSADGFSDTWRVFLAGAALLFWELALIRWMGSSVRVVAYFTNFVLLAAFLGTGVGAILSARRKGGKSSAPPDVGLLAVWLPPSLLGVVVLAAVLGGFHHANPMDEGEFIWKGGPMAVVPERPLEFMAWAFSGIELPYWLVLGLCFTAITGVFALFGRLIGDLFARLPPLKAYSAEIGGSCAGIALFGAASALGLSPSFWFLVGFVLLWGALGGPAAGRKPSAALALSALITLAAAYPYEKPYRWSPYYRIAVYPLKELREGNRLIRYPEPYGYQVVVNSDYHQMALNLAAPGQAALDAGEVGPEFFTIWREVYGYPHSFDGELPQGPVLIVGGGTGNDVAAALRHTSRDVHVVDIDREIMDLGRAIHPEKPYSNSRVTAHVTDARAFFERAPSGTYSKVVFGFLDSHTLMSSFSSLRLDNFVYTVDSLRSAYRILKPGGEIYLTFSVVRPWIQERMLRMLEAVAGSKPEVWTDRQDFTSAVIYRIRKPASAGPSSEVTVRARADEGVPSDDWPFLYLRDLKIPDHYLGFMAFVLILSAGAFRLLPVGARRIRLPYFFMGSGFFLMETVNVVRLSVLYGSTWVVNVTVFLGILLLVLAANWTVMRLPKIPLKPVFAALFLSLGLAYALSPQYLLGMSSPWLQGGVAVAVFLGPIYFAGIVFARLIHKEKNLAAAYGSNLLGAMLGGVAEYLCLVTGFQSLLLVGAGFYLLVLVMLPRSGGLKA